MKSGWNHADASGDHGFYVASFSVRTWSEIRGHPGSLTEPAAKTVQSVVLLSETTPTTRAMFGDFFGKLPIEFFTASSV